MINGQEHSDACESCSIKLLIIFFHKFISMVVLIMNDSPFLPNIFITVIFFLGPGFLKLGVQVAMRHNLYKLHIYKRVRGFYCFICIALFSH